MRSKDRKIILLELPNPNIFMLCEQVNEYAYRDMPQAFTIRQCRKDDLTLWKRMQFDDEAMANEYAGFMDDYFDLVYAPKGNMFFEKCLFAVNKNDEPVGTGFSWKSYNTVTTMGWFKVVKAYEGQGIGRALLTEVMRSLSDSDYPMLLHTQPSSERAIKLYTDFGFKILTDKKVGNRENHIEECLPVLNAAMPQKDYDNLQFTTAPKHLLDFLSKQALDEF